MHYIKNQLVYNNNNISIYLNILFKKYDTKVPKNIATIKLTNTINMTTIKATKISTLDFDFIFDTNSQSIIS